MNVIICFYGQNKSTTPKSKPPRIKQYAYNTFIVHLWPYLIVLYLILGFCPADALFDGLEDYITKFAKPKIQHMSKDRFSSKLNEFTSCKQHSFSNRCKIFRLVWNWFKKNQIRVNVLQWNWILNRVQLCFFKILESNTAFCDDLRGLS